MSRRSLLVAATGALLVSGLASLPTLWNWMVERERWPPALVDALERRDAGDVKAQIERLPHLGKRDPRLVASAAVLLTDRGEDAVVQSLLARGMDPNVQDGAGDLVLHKAAARGRLPLVQALVSGGAKVQARDGYGYTALERAIEARHPAVVRYLISQGADVNLGLIWAAGQGDLAMVHQLLLRSTDVNARGSWALFAAMHQGNLEVMRALIRAGADVNGTSPEGIRPLHIAAETGSALRVRLLLEHGAVVDSRDNRGRTALHCAAEAGSLPAARLLMEHGAQVNATTSMGHTVFDTLVATWEHRNVDRGEFIRFLKKRGAKSGFPHGSPRGGAAARRGTSTERTRRE